VIQLGEQYVGTTLEECISFAPGFEQTLKGQLADLRRTRHLYTLFPITIIIIAAAAVPANDGRNDDMFKSHLRER
jgi:hypothetical protein